MIIVYPLWRGRRLAILDSNTANVAVLKDQLQELEADSVNGHIAGDQYDRARMDLESAIAVDLLQDIDQPVRPMSVKMRRLLSLILVILLPLASIVLYRELTTDQTQLTRQQAARQNMAQQSRQELPSIDQMVEKLETKLRDDPDNAEGWQMLGRSYVVLDRISDAVNAYARSYALFGDTNVEVLADYAEVLAFASDSSMKGKPAELVNKALQLDPEHAKSLWLAGFAAMQSDNVELALQHWQKLLTRPDISEQISDMVKRNISRIQGFAEPGAVSPEVGVSSGDVAAVQNAESALSVKVDVVLHESLKNRVRAG